MGPNHPIHSGAVRLRIYSGRRCTFWRSHRGRACGSCGSCSSPPARFTHSRSGEGFAVRIFGSDWGKGFGLWSRSGVVCSSPPDVVCSSPPGGGGCGDGYVPCARRRNPGSVTASNAKVCGPRGPSGWGGSAKCNRRQREGSNRGVLKRPANRSSRPLRPLLDCRVLRSGRCARSFPLPCSLGWYRPRCRVYLSFRRFLSRNRSTRAMRTLSLT